MKLQDWARASLRHANRAAVLALAILAAGIVTSFSVELGPSLRGRAESAGTNYLKRPLHIGGLSVRLFDGRFVVRDIAIEGLAKTDAPFFKAGEILVSMPLWALLRRELIIESVELTDWSMAVETWPGDKNNFPQLPKGGGGGKSAIKVTASYVHAYRGQFLFDDHRNWSTLVRNLDITVMKLVGYRGTARSSGGRVSIGSFVPMSMGMTTWFKVEGGKVLVERMDLKTYGADTIVQGFADVAHWPEMRYNIRSTIDMPKIREIFWEHASFSLSGTMQFQGQFRLFRGGHEVAGHFYSEEAGINRFRFGDLDGSLLWTPWRFEVLKANSRFYGGAASYTYLMNPLGGERPGVARLDASYENVDLAEFSDGVQMDGLRLAGRATGRNVLEWPIGQFAGHAGFGDLQVEAPPHVVLQGRSLPAKMPEPSFAHVYGDPFPKLDHVPIGGELHYSYGPEWIDFGLCRVATPFTFVEFQGRTAYGDRSHLPFHVTSRDWQESDRILAGIMTSVGSRTNPIEIGGMGTFDGVLLNAISRPRIEGLVRGQGLRAWDTDWGTGQSRIVVENSYTEVLDATLRKGDAELQVEGRFSMGFPREDKGEEINARFITLRWPLPDLRHSFDLDEYPLDGKLSGEFHLYGGYKGPFGFGRATIAPAKAYGERLESASGSLRFDGTGCWFDGVDIRKSGGTIRGSARIAWAGTYSFNADARQIPLDAVDAMTFPQAPLTGVLDFTAGGSGAFANVEFDVNGRMRDVFLGDEGLGEISGKIGMRGENINFELRAGSSRLEASMVGRVNRRYTTYPGEITLRVTDASLDPYVRLFAGGLSPYARAVVTGTARVSGTLGDLDGLVARAVVDKVDVSLFDYSLHNDGPIDIGLDQDNLVIHRFNLAGENTRLAFSGSVNLDSRSVGLRAEGDANLGILQAFSGNVRGSGRAQLRADVTGTIDRPQIAGSAMVDKGRLRHLMAPHALEEINGRIVFSDNSIRFDELVAKMGGGNVRFGGRVQLHGLTPAQLDVTATGDSMQWRYPTGMRSLVDADLALRGRMEDPLLSGTVSIRNAVYWKRVDVGAGLELAGSGAAAPSASPALAFPLRLDIRVLAPSSLEVDNNVGRLRATADLTVRGTLEKPDIRGRAEVEKGDVWFEGRRYVVTRGTFDFVTPGKIDPYFDVEAETRARTPGQTYRVRLRATGNLQRIDHELSSDPPLPEVDIVAMLLGDVRSTQDAELRALQSPNTVQQTLIQSRAARLLASPLSSTVQKAVETTIGLDTFQITPQLTDPTQQTARMAPGARLTIGKRISDRVYLTYSRNLASAGSDQILLLEYDQSDRLSWILTQNEDRTYALDVRVRRVFK